ncbi:universal stress protein [Dokdonella sp.]|uniref:universal stress protein n=1 Tax=Dokdonella sp. TaxID=2291710 RepID=UPI002F408DA5
MFQRILVPTDGSALSKKAVRAAIKLAAGTGASLVAFHAIPKFRTFTFDTQMLEGSAGGYRTASIAHARELLAGVAAEARKAGVACDTVHASSDEPYAAIIREAKRKHCDLILMASHGRKGLQSLLLGSETQKVLTHGTLPVLVYR